MSVLNDKNHTPAILWDGKTLSLLDQRYLPQRETYNRYTSAPEVARAIKNMVVRGAPAIGISAAYAVVLSAIEHDMDYAWIAGDMQTLADARPTARNMFWALGKMAELIKSKPSLEEMIKLAESVHLDDINHNYLIGEIGSKYLSKNSKVLTHCNAGALATGGYGTALGVIRSGWEKGLISEVYADETRPWMQGSRLTAWELIKDRINVRIIADSAAAWLMKTKKLNWLIVGSDRVAANGDAANKIGTYQAAIAAKYHGVKVMVAAPMSTVDFSLASGDDIPLENRPIAEVLECGGTRIAALGASSWNPVFDITPAALIDVLVTEKGAVEKPDAAKISAFA